VKQLNPSFAAPSRPFLRMSYIDAIGWLNEHGIQHEAEDADGNPILDADGKAKMVDHAIGDDIAEAAERQMTDILGVPMFLYGFPAELKAFYMKKMPKQDGQSKLFTESCDLLMPGVGEIVGMSSYFSFWTKAKAITDPQVAQCVLRTWRNFSRPMDVRALIQLRTTGSRISGSTEPASTVDMGLASSASLLGWPTVTLSGALIVKNR
jgi:hypothetical protein